MSGETGVIIAGKECMRSSLMIIEGVEKFFKTEFHFFLLSESVRDGHPGKICNQFFFLTLGWLHVSLVNTTRSAWHTFSRKRTHLCTPHHVAFQT